MSKSILWSATTVLLLMVAGPITTGCYNIHRHHEIRPGELEIREPPPRMDVPERVHPHDSYRSRFIAFSARPLYDVRLGRREDGRSTTNRFGGQVTFKYSPHLILFAYTRTEVQEPKYDEVIPYGIGLGCAPCLPIQTDRPRWFLEAERTILIARAAAGWSFEPTTARHGPQVTLGLGDIFHLRWYHHMGEGSSFFFGVSLPLIYQIVTIDY
jgi:hypothetical protein